MLFRSREWIAPRRVTVSGQRFGLESSAGMSLAGSAWLRTGIARPIHTYDEEVAAAIYKSLPEYAALFATLLAELEERERQREEEESQGSKE